jgi:hypothetical protein
MDMEKGRRICVVGIVFAVLLAVGITYSGLVLTGLSAEGREVNSDVAHGNSVYYVAGKSYSENPTGLFKVNATAVFPRAIDVHRMLFYVNVTFAIMLPANASYLSVYDVEAHFSPSPNWNWEPNESLAIGWGIFSGGMPVNVVPMGGTGIDFWNVTVGMQPSLTTVDISKNQSWLSLISQAEMYLSIVLEGEGNMTVTNGTNRSYGLEAYFSFQGTPATFYGFGLSVGAWLVYGGLVLIEVASLFYWRRLHKKKVRKQFDSGV